jgi:hypothetical protein
LYIYFINDFGSLDDVESKTPVDLWTLISLASRVLSSMVLAILTTKRLATSTDSLHRRTCATQTTVFNQPKDGGEIK